MASAICSGEPDATGEAAGVRLLRLLRLRLGRLGWTTPG